MNWNYRVFGNLEKGYQICEVYYKRNSPEGMTAEPMEPFGRTRQELKKDLKDMLEALDKPTFKEPKKWKK